MLVQVKLLQLLVIRDRNSGILIRGYLMDSLLDIVLGMLHISLLGCLMLMGIDFLEEMLKIGMSMLKVQKQRQQELKHLSMLLKFEGLLFMVL